MPIIGNNIVYIQNNCVYNKPGVDIRTEIKWWLAEGG